MFCRIQSQNPESEMDNYASFINEALEKTKCRECVPCWEEIQTLMNRQKMLCTVHYPGPGSCQLYISSHTTANEVGGHFYSSQLCSGSNFEKSSLLFLPPNEPFGCSSVISPNFQVVRRMQEKLGLQDSNNTFALYKQNSVWEQPVAGSALIADVLTRFVK